MQRMPINPVQWSAALGFHQGELFTDPTRVLFTSGQTAVDADGNPQHAGDMAAQLELALANLEAVLEHADMTLANLARLTVYTTDADDTLEHYGVLAGRLGASGASPTTTLLGVTRLAMPTLLVELEGTALA